MFCDIIPSKDACDGKDTLWNSRSVKHIKKEYLGNGFEEQIIEVCECIKNSKTESETMPVDKSIEILKQMDEIRAQVGVIYPNER